MYKEFEGKTEQEAIDKAVKELSLEREDFDVEVISSQKKSLFRKGSVVIRVHVPDDEEAMPEETDSEELSIPGQVLEPQSEDERKIVAFVETLVEKMGYKAEVVINFRRDYKLGLDVRSDSSSIIIGRKGQNLNAIQLLANVYAGNIDKDYKIIVDSENYRMRHEEQIVHNALKTAEYVRRSHRSRLLAPMNPFERRLIHTALNDFDGVETKSEGEGLYKQVRILPVKKNRKEIKNSEKAGL